MESPQLELGRLRYGRVQKTVVSGVAGEDSGEEVEVAVRGSGARADMFVIGLVMGLGDTSP